MHVDTACARRDAAEQRLCEHLRRCLMPCFRRLRCGGTLKALEDRSSSARTVAGRQLSAWRIESCWEQMEVLATECQRMLDTNEPKASIERLHMLQADDDKLRKSSNLGS